MDQNFTIKGTVENNTIKSISEINLNGEVFTLGDNTAQILEELNKCKVEVEVEGTVIKLKKTQAIGGNYKKSRRNKNKRRKTNKRTP